MNRIAVDPLRFKRILQRNVTLPLAICALLCAIFVVMVINLINVTKWVDHTNQVITKANETLKLVIDSETGYRGFIVADRGEFLQPYYEAMEVLDSELQDLKKMVRDNPHQTQQMDIIIDRFLEWKNYVSTGVENRDKILSDVKKGHNLGKRFMDEIRREFSRFITTEHALRDERVESIRQQTQIMLIVTIVFSIIAGVFLALAGRKSLMSLSESFDGAFKKVAEQNEILAEQTWLRTGQAEMGNKIRGEMNLHELGRSALNFLSEHIRVSLGALFVLEGAKLNRVATLAFPESADKAPGHFKIGEGMVGESARRQEMIRLEGLPEDYFVIQSGLGEKPPKDVIIFPLVVEGSVQGVMELGFLDQVKEKEIKFLHQISETMGIAVRSAIYRMKLQDLLEETQTQAEELQTQQEELKVSNEELIERSHALTLAQGKMEAQHAELEQINEELKTQKLALDAQNRSLRETQIEVEKKSRDLEQASQYKSEFLANMSHELRTPLNSTLILSKLLKDNTKGNLTPEQVNFADTIYAAGSDLLSLINDILDLSKVEAGKLDVYLEKFSLDKLVKSLEGLFRPVVETKNLKFVIDIGPDVPSILFSDRQRLEQILKNLLSNAIKFTSQGSITLKVNKVQGNISFSVTDSGIGISPEQLNVIFEAFRQADGTTNRKYGGTGLGLTISRNLATLLGGYIEASSEEGGGSTFTLTIPSEYHNSLAQERKNDFLRPAVEESLKPRQIFTEIFEGDDHHLLPAEGKKLLLVVEDDRPFAQVLLDMAHDQGFLCLIALSAQQGQEYAQQYLPDAIILDMKLPDSLGLGLLDKLKEDPRTRHIPVHGISAIDYSREALHLGAVGYLMKPANESELRRTIQGLETKINQRMKKVLIVEDEPKQRMAIEKLISDDFIEITAVGTGAETLKKLEASQFDCVILDLSLPDISGFELLEKLAQGEDTSYPPVIIYTGKVLTEAEEDKLRRYSETIIIKGARSPERLLDEVTLFLHQVESQLPEEKQKILKTGRGQEKAFEGKNILLVDDDVRNIFALMSVLETKGAHVVVARNGREAIERFSENVKIDLVLMDIMMPEMDGYATMKKIRTELKLEKLPIIAVTAKAMRNDYSKCIEAGANDYISKPVEVDKLLSIMRVWMPRH